MTAVRPPRRLSFVQLPVPPLAPGPVRGNVPLAGAYLVSALRRALGERVEASLFPPECVNRLGDAALAAAILAERPDWVGLTCYVWNAARSLRLVRLLKAARPELVVVLGGPEVSPDNGWLLAHDGFDLAVHGEGEATIVDLARAAGAGTPLTEVPGLLLPTGGGWRATAARPLLADLSGVGAPYQEGLLDPRAEGMVLTETSRGCRYRCGFCAYPQGRRAPQPLDDERLWADLALARREGVRELYLLDPSLNQRRDFPAFVERLAARNPAPGVELFGELRAEAVDGALADAMARAGFREVELGLQSTSPAAGRLMRRHNDLARFVAGATALRAAGLRAKVDTIVGLPGDTPDSVRATLDFVAEHGLGDDPLVFPLAVLPGTEFRRRAAELGLRHQPHPPYQIQGTPTMDTGDIAGLFAAAEERFEVELDPPPRPLLADPAHDGARGDSARARCDLDAPRAPLPAEPDACFTLWLRTGAPFATRDRAAEAVAGVAAQNPHGTLHVVLETGGPFPYDVLDAVRGAWTPPADHYLEAFHAATAPAAPVSRRLYVTLPASAVDRVDFSWRLDLPPGVALVWRLPPGDLAAALNALARLDPPDDEWALLSLPADTDRAALERLRREAERHGWEELLLFDRAQHQALWDSL